MPKITGKDPVPADSGAGHGYYLKRLTGKDGSSDNPTKNHDPYDLGITKISGDLLNPDGETSSLYPDSRYLLKPGERYTGPPIIDLIKTLKYNKRYGVEEVDMAALGYSFSASVGEDDVQALLEEGASYGDLDTIVGTAYTKGPMAEVIKGEKAIYVQNDGKSSRVIEEGLVEVARKLLAMDADAQKAYFIEVHSQIVGKTEGELGDRFQENQGSIAAELNYIADKMKLSGIEGMELKGMQLVARVDRDYMDLSAIIGKFPPIIIDYKSDPLELRGYPGLDLGHPR